jgi:hypothetical protein
MILYDEDDNPSHPALRKRILESAGPMAPSGNPHGMWVDTVYDNSEALDLVGNSRTAFYWYGDEVSEGEWHLRNK